MGNFFNRFGHLLLLVIERAMWPATKALFTFMWEVVRLVTLPIAKRSGELGATLLPYGVGIAGVMGGLYAILDAPQHLQDQAIACIALVLFFVLLLAAFKPSTKKIGPPSQHNGRRRSR